MGKKLRAVKAACAAIVIIAVIAACLPALSGMGQGSEEKAMRTLEDAVRRAAVSCYAAEGQYPPTVDKLIEKYGVRPDGRFFIHYEAFAPNLAPDVTVVKLPTQEEMWGRK